MKIRSAELETVCGITSRLPRNERSEVAFAGRSNVGKSSLINALLGRKSLARTSSRPGKTQTINFYRINRGTPEIDVTEGGFAPDMYLVDLPGYGYAGVPEAEKAKWGPMIERYLHSSSKLRAVFLLIDIRHTPSRDDVMMADWIRRNGFEPVIVVTKADKIKRSQIRKNTDEIRRALGLSKDARLCLTSAETGAGIEAVWEEMCRDVPEAGAAEAGEEAGPCVAAEHGGPAGPDPAKGTDRGGVKQKEENGDH